MRTFNLAACSWIVATSCLAAEPGDSPQRQSESRSPTPDSRLPVATVDGQPIYASEVAAELRQAYGDRELSAERRKALHEAALTQVIDRRLVLGYLTRSGLAASRQDVDFALAQLEKQLTAQDLTLAQHCKSLGLEVEQVRQSLAWKLSWQTYLAEQLTDANLQKYFDRHRADFDGTQLRMAHILIKPAADDAAGWDAAQTKAQSLAQSIASGKQTFAAAARESSAAPTGMAGGDIGWIERRQPMPEEFSRAAFALKPGTVSQPVRSPAGIHLIQVLEIKPGQRTWQDAAAELKPAMTLYLFRWIAGKERDKVTVVRSARRD